MAVQKLQQSEKKTTYRVLHQLTEKEKQEGSIFVKIKKNKSSRSCSTIVIEHDNNYS